MEKIIRDMYFNLKSEEVKLINYKNIRKCIVKHIEILALFGLFTFYYI